jgi:membrane-bound metal-dependent hydrolase YbcI (DUF457 family)
MFIGHFGLGLAAKKISGRPSLGTYFLAAQFLDLLWPMLLIRDIEKVEVQPGNTAFTPLNFVSYPYSHSLIASLFWSVLFGIFYLVVTRDRKNSLLLGILVFSHWVLDFFTHRPDLPLSPWSENKFGLGLWNYFWATMIIELIIFIGGAWLYISATSAKNKTGFFSLWGFLLFMIAVYFMNAFSPPPHSTHAIALLGLTQFILIAWAYWIDANRESSNQKTIIPPYGGRTAKAI